MVNVIGIFAFQHGGSHHGHSHAGGGHGHSHTGAGHGHSHVDTSHHGHGHGHSHTAHPRGGHGHSHAGNSHASIYRCHNFSFIVLGMGKLTVCQMINYLQYLTVKKLRFLNFDERLHHQRPTAF